MGSMCGKSYEEKLVRRAFGIKSYHDEFESQAINTSNFTLIRVIGIGSFGKVILVRKKDTNQEFAVKVISKLRLVQESSKNHAMTERRVLEGIHSPFIVKLHYAFQTSEKLYLVMDYIPCGDLLTLLNKVPRFSYELTRLYTAEILIALRDLHRADVLYRDLKPENILVDSEGHLALTDFHLSHSELGQTRGTTICGTPEYMAPEVIYREQHTKAVDYWSLGILICEMISGRTPYSDDDYEEMFKKILIGQFELDNDIREEAKDLIKRLLVVEPKDRLQDFDEMARHEFFRGLDWSAVEAKMIPVPCLRGMQEGDQNSTIRIENEECTPSPDWNTIEKRENLFCEFTYTSSL